MRSDGVVMKIILPALGAAAALALLSSPVDAGERYAEPPPLVVSPDLSAPWVLQLRRVPRNVRVAPAPANRYPVQRYEPGDPLPSRAAYTRIPAPDLRNSYVIPQGPGRAPKVVPMYTPEEMRQPFDPKFLPREVSYDGPQKPGTIVIDTKTKFLYLVQEGGKARRYGVGVGKEGFGWTGTNPITRKAEWPGWTPPAEMIEREKEKGRILPVHMEGGPQNPLGARALYLGDTLYRIHGTNAPWTIGHNVSSGCIRMRNEDVIDLYERVKVGTKVVVM
jgi:lipoprotein-anchoring transpeptidase ErfK/SrfK